MKCPNCNMELQLEVRRDYTKPLFALLILLLTALFFVGIRMRGENESLKSKIIQLEKKIEYYGSTLLDYQKAIEKFIQKMPEGKTK
ncbi:MAG: hypothetical protein AB1502_11030 [Thermodesulfobacteriota bacterium]